MQTQNGEASGLAPEVLYTVTAIITILFGTYYYIQSEYPSFFDDIVERRTSFNEIISFLINHLDIFLVAFGLLILSIIINIFFVGSHRRYRSHGKHDEDDGGYGGGFDGGDGDE